MSDDYAERLNASPEAWVRANALHFVTATRDEVVAEWEIQPHQLQAYGIVHGGVHCGVIETLASIGAALDAWPRNQSVVGLENHTSFIRAVRGGRLRAAARPITRGRRTQVWEVHVRDDQDRTVATGRVRLLCLEAETPLGGEPVGLQPSVADG